MFDVKLKKIQKGKSMRTTLDLEEDVLLAVKELARGQGLSMGKVLSDLVRQALSNQQVTVNLVRNGVPLFPVSAYPSPVTLELVNQLRDEE